MIDLAYGAAASNEHETQPSIALRTAVRPLAALTVTKDSTVPILASSKILKQSEYIMSIKAIFFTLLASSSAVLAAPSCDNAPSVPVSDAQDALDNIRSWEGRHCNGVQGGIEWFQSGEARIRGLSDKEDGTSSYCTDAATSAQEIIDSCSKDGRTGGTNIAVGNGDLTVEITTVPTA
ncbi:hypothetical protein BDW62DRAFT_198368 [Aspergillus aurantiobrunneus]